MSSPNTRKHAPDCPICGGAQTPAHSPFCSQGCRDRDLLRWLGDGYRIPGPPAGAEDIEKLHAGLDSQP